MSVARFTSNSLSDMTGFARVSGQYGSHNWQWEARSVNGKSLDVRVRVPSDFSGLDGAVRKAFADVFTRGNVQVSLTLSSADNAARFAVNDDLFDVLSKFIASKGGTPDPHHILQIEGVVSEADATMADDEKAALKNALLESAKALAAELKQARGTEGQALAPILLLAVEAIEAQVKAAGALAATQPDAILAGLQASIEELKGQGLDDDRLAQEAALLAVKADIREELDRLKAHCDQARVLLAQGSPIGRKLGFLSQEFNREANTLCAKSSSIELTQIGLDMKSVIEQFREQAANVE